MTMLITRIARARMRIGLVHGGAAVLSWNTVGQWEVTRGDELLEAHGDIDMIATNKERKDDEQPEEETDCG